MEAANTRNRNSDKLKKLKHSNLFYTFLENVLEREKIDTEEKKKCDRCKSTIPNNRSPNGRSRPKKFKFDDDNLDLY